MECIFGQSPILPEALSERLITEAARLARQFDNTESNTAWTYGIKTALEILANENHCRALFSKKHECAEFLLDVVWWRDSRDGSRALLGVESEWGNTRDRSDTGVADAVYADFEKLLSFKAPLKIMVYTADTLTMRRAIHDKLRRAIRDFAQHVQGEYYLLMEFSPPAKCYRYKFVPNDHGYLPQGEIVPLDTESNSALAA